jgi:hypothetical protein
MVTTTCDDNDVLQLALSEEGNVLVNAVDGLCDVQTVQIKDPSCYLLLGITQRVHISSSLHTEKVDPYSHDEVEVHRSPVHEVASSRH